MCANAESIMPSHRMAEHEEKCVVHLAAVTIMIPDECGRRLETVRVGECVLATCSLPTGHHKHDS